VRRQMAAEKLFLRTFHGFRDRQWIGTVGIFAV